MASEKNGKQIESFPSAAFKQNSKHSRMAGKLNKILLIFPQQIQQNCLLFLLKRMFVRIVRSNVKCIYMMAC